MHNVPFCPQTIVVVTLLVEEEAAEHEGGPRQTEPLGEGVEEAGQFVVQERLGDGSQRRERRQGQGAAVGIFVTGTGGVLKVVELETERHKGAAKLRERGREIVRGEDLAESTAAVDKSERGVGLGLLRSALRRLRPEQNLVQHVQRGGKFNRKGQERKEGRCS